MKQFKAIIITLFLFFYTTIAWASGHIVVANVTASQEGNWIVVNYDLSHSGDGEIFIELEFAANGTDFTLVSPKNERIDGDINIVEPGTGKEIRWQAAAALSGQFSNSAKTRIKADYRFIGVAGHPGVILDKSTGLMWPQNALMTKGVDSIDDDGRRTLNDAKAWVENMNSGIKSNFGFTDWALPSLSQLKTLYSSKYNAGPPGHPFTNYTNENYWWTSSCPSDCSSTSVTYYCSPYNSFSCSQTSHPSVTYKVWAVRSKN